MTSANSECPTLTSSAAALIRTEFNTPNQSASHPRVPTYHFAQPTPPVPRHGRLLPSVRNQTTHQPISVVLQNDKLQKTRRSSSGWTIWTAHTAISRKSSCPPPCWHIWCLRHLSTSWCTLFNQRLAQSYTRNRIHNSSPSCPFLEEAQTR